jgi:hypothetical protein
MKVRTKVAKQMVAVVAAVALVVMALLAFPVAKVTLWAGTSYGGWAAVVVVLAGMAVDIAAGIAAAYIVGMKLDRVVGPWLEAREKQPGAREPNLYTEPAQPEA